MADDYRDVCSGCGAESERHPILGLDISPHGLTKELSICRACWLYPEHRRQHLSCAFFELDGATDESAAAPRAARAPHTAAPPASQSGAGLTLSEGLADTIVQAIGIAVKPLYERIRALRKRIDLLEASPALKYCGVWQSATVYSAGDAVTKQGSLWIAKLNHLESEPGVDHVGWQLAVKRGRDGKGR